MTRPVDDLIELPKLLGIADELRFVRRLVEPGEDGEDTIVALLGGVDADGSWSQACVEVLRTRTRDCSRVQVPARSVERVFRGSERHVPADTPALPGWALDDAYLTRHRAWLSEQTASAELAGLPSSALAATIAAWTECGYRRPLPALLGAIRQLAEIDGSLAWTGIAALLAQTYLAAFGDATAQRVAGSVTTPLAGSGVLTRTCGRLLVSGQWKRTPGALEVRWLLLPVTDAATPGSALLACVPASDAEIVAAPAQAGLRGAGDHEIRLAAVPVTASRIVPVTDARHGALAQLTPTVLRTALIAMASAALATSLLTGIIELARTKIRSGTTEPLFADPSVLASLVTASVELRALTGALFEVCGPVAATDATDDNALANAADIVVTARVVTQRAVEHAERAFRPVGASALFQDSPMQRSLRDLLTVSRHLPGGGDFFRAAAMTHLGVCTPHRELALPIAEGDS
jgi:alkylation response protein AidB-like acyl-CoA dehydrogenase